MKNILLLQFFTFLLFGCTPDNPSDPNNQTTSICPQPKLSFKGNGVLYECNAVADSRLGWVGYPRFFQRSMFSSNGGSIVAHGLSFCNIKDLDDSYSENGSWAVNYPFTQNTVFGNIFFGSNITILNVGNFSSNDVIMDFNNENYRYEGNSNRIILNITSLNNGLASGTFSGTLPAGNGGTSPNDGPQMNITDGIFSNIPVFK